MRFILGCCGNSSPETELFVLRLKRRWRTGDWKTSERLAHTVKGVAGNLGAFQVHAEAGKLESLLGGRQAPEEVDRQLAILKTTLAQLFTDLEHALPRRSPKSGSRRARLGAGEGRVRAA